MWKVKDENHRQYPTQSSSVVVISLRLNDRNELSGYKLRIRSASGSHQVDDPGSQEEPLNINIKYV